MIKNGAPVNVSHSKSIAGTIQLVDDFGVHNKNRANINVLNDSINTNNTSMTPTVK